MAKRNPTTYRATFTGLRAHAFGIPQVLDWAPEIEIYQARVSPELWRARPMMEHAAHKWQASSAEELQRLITADFVGILKPWRPWLGNHTATAILEAVERSDDKQKRAG